MAPRAGRNPRGCAFYPKGTRPGDFLAHYADRFATVEADNTYYAVPEPRLVEGWVRKTPDDFILSAKFPRSIVHGGEGPRPDPGDWAWITIWRRSIWTCTAPRSVKALRAALGSRTSFKSWLKANSPISTAIKSKPANRASLPKSNRA